MDEKKKQEIETEVEGKVFVECDAEECKHWQKDADGRCVCPELHVAVWNGHQSGHYAEAGCTSFEEAPGRIDLGDAEKVTDSVEWGESVVAKEMRN